MTLQNQRVNLQKGYEAAKSSGVLFEPDQASHIQEEKKKQKKT